MRRELSSTGKVPPIRALAALVGIAGMLAGALAHASGTYSSVAQPRGTHARVSHPSVAHANATISSATPAAALSQEGARKIVDGYLPLYSSMWGAAGGYAYVAANGSHGRVVDELTGKTVRGNVDLGNNDSRRISGDGGLYASDRGDIVRMDIETGRVSVAGELPYRFTFGRGQGDFSDDFTRLPILSDDKTRVGIFDLPSRTYYEAEISGCVDAAELAADGSAISVVRCGGGHALHRLEGDRLVAAGSLAPATGHSCMGRMPDGGPALITTTVGWPVDGVPGYTGNVAQHFIVAASMVTAPQRWSDYVVVMGPPILTWQDSVLCHARGDDVLVSVYNSGPFRLLLGNTDGRGATTLFSRDLPGGWGDYYNSGFGSFNREGTLAIFGFDDGNDRGTWTVPVSLADRDR